MKDGVDKFVKSRINRGRMFTQLQVQRLKRMLNKEEKWVFKRNDKNYVLLY
jgi:hypothetical protein